MRRTRTSEECYSPLGLARLIRLGQEGETISLGLYFPLWKRWESRVIRALIPLTVVLSLLLLVRPPDDILTRLLTGVPLVGLLCAYFWLLGWRHARDLSATKATESEVVLNHRLAFYPWQGSDTVAVVTLAPETDSSTLLALSGYRVDTHEDRP